MLDACAGAVLMHGTACGRPSAWVAELTGIVYLFSLVTKHDPGAVPGIKPHANQTRTIQSLVRKQGL